VVKSHCNCPKELKIQVFQDCFSRYDYGCLDKNGGKASMNFVTHSATKWNLAGFEKKPNITSTASFML
jgi:hypothetical protein